MIYCCGESLIDMIPGRDSRNLRAYTPVVGGSVFNTAIALGRLGARVGFISGVSTDSFGQMILQSLQKSGVETSRLIRSHRLTTLAFVTMADGNAQYTFYDENSAGRMLAPADMPSALAQAEILMFGGISLACDPCADSYMYLMRQMAGKAVIMVDLNIRQGFISDEKAFRRRLQKAVATADIVKTSAEDLSWFLGTHASDRIADFADQIGGCLIVTRGAEGAELHRGKSILSVSAPKVTVQDTIGAGDTFNAGFLEVLQQAGVSKNTAIDQIDSDVLRKGLHRGAQLASLVVQRPGADPPWASELGNV